MGKWIRIDTIVWMGNDRSGTQEERSGEGRFCRLMELGASMSRRSGASDKQSDPPQSEFCPGRRNL